MVPECTYVTQLMRHYYDIVNYSDAQRFATYAVSDAQLAATFQRTIDTMIAVAGSHFSWYEFDRQVLKDPELTRFVDLIPTFFEAETKVVYVVRDPRDVVASLLRVYQSDAESAVSVESIISDVYQYFWSAHESKMMKNGKLHAVCFEKILQKDEAEFIKIEDYLGFKIGRHGFAKVHFEPDKADRTYSANYGKAITELDDKSAEAFVGTHITNRIRTTFSGFNEIYNWWSVE